MDIDHTELSTGNTNYFRVNAQSAISQEPVDLTWPGPNDPPQTYTSGLGGFYGAYVYGGFFTPYIKVQWTNN
jgi:hypothetical protein